MHLANFNPKGRVMFQDNDPCKDCRQRKCWSDWVKARDDPWNREGCNNIEKSDLFSYLGDPISLASCSQCRPSQTLLSRKTQSDLQKLFLSSIEKKGMSKKWTGNTGTISPNNQKILSGMNCFCGFPFSFIEVAPQAPLDRCNSINWSQSLVSMPCVEAAHKFLDGWRFLIFCVFVKGITVSPVLGLSWGLQDFFFLYPQSSGQHIHYKGQKDCTDSWGPAFSADLKFVSIWLCWRREKSECS